MPTKRGTKSADSPYQLQLFGNLPLYTTRLTRLVREDTLPWPRMQLSSPEDVASFFQSYFPDKPTEEFWVVLLNTANVVIGCSQISRGGLAASIVEPRAVFQTAVLANAAAIICLHNHPSGAPRGAYVEC